MESRSKDSDSPLSVHSSFASFFVITENTDTELEDSGTGRNKKMLACFAITGQSKKKIFIRQGGERMTMRPEIIQKQWALARQMLLIYGKAVHFQAGSVISPCYHSRSVCYLLQKGAPLPSVSAAWQYTNESCDMYSKRIYQLAEWKENCFYT